MSPPGAKSRPVPERGFRVTAIDNSPLAVTAMPRSERRGVARASRCAPGAGRYRAPVQRRAQRAVRGPVIESEMVVLLSKYRSTKTDAVKGTPADPNQSCPFNRPRVPRSVYERVWPAQALAGPSWSSPPSLDEPDSQVDHAGIQQRTGTQFRKRYVVASTRMDLWRATGLEHRSSQTS
jgi:hypothetical protein